MLQIIMIFFFFWSVMAAPYPAKSVRHVEQMSSNKHFNETVKYKSVEFLFYFQDVRNKIKEYFLFI